MTTSEFKKVDKQAFWTERLKEAQAFPGGLRQYCRASEISYTGMLYWRRRLMGPVRNSIPVRIAKVSAKNSPFVRIERAAEPLPRLPPPELRASRLGQSPGAQFVAEVLWHMAVLGRE